MKEHSFEIAVQMKTEDYVSWKTIEHRANSSRVFIMDTVDEDVNFYLYELNV